MGTIRYEIKKGTKPTPKQLEEIHAATARPHVYDEDCPPFTEEELKRFRRVSEKRKADAYANRKQTVTIRLKPQALERAKSLGKGYTGILSHILENVLDDPQKLEALIK